MPKPPDDPWPDGDPVLAALAEDLRIVASGPAPEPRPGLVAVMGRGAPFVGTTTRRPKMLVKTVLGSLAAKLALGVGVAAASVTAAGAAGVLPDQAQHAVASVVGATTPFVLPDPSAVRVTDHDDVVSPTTSTTEAREAEDTDDHRPGGAVTGTGTGTGGTGTGATGEPENHGACVSAAAHDTSGTQPHGKSVSSVARSDCGKAPTSSTSVVPSTSTSAPTTSTTVAGQHHGPARVDRGKDGSDDGGSGGGDKGPSSGKAGSDKG